MRILKSAVVVAALALASPVWAGGGNHHGHHHGWDKHRYSADRGHHGHHRHDGWHDGRVPRYYSYNTYYAPYQPYVYAPPPAYVYAPPRPGVHIVVPNIYIPLR